MERKILSAGSAIKLTNSTGAKNYVIDKVIGRGAHCIAYEAHSIDSVNRRVRIKECFPAGLGINRTKTGELVWPDESTKESSIEMFKKAYEKQVAIQNDERFVNTFIHIVDDVCNANNTLYTVVGIDNGVTFSDDETNDLQDILFTIRTLARVISLYHNNGYLYLDIKPENFLVIPETRDMIKLFDSDTIIKKENLESGDISIIPYTVGWAAPEQVMGRKKIVSERTDIYAIGAVLFSKLMERCPDNDDIGVYADYDIPEYWTEKYDSRIISAIKRIFRNTITASTKRRFKKVEDLIDALDDAIKICSTDEYILPKESISDIYFVGRNNELEEIHKQLQGNTKVVFIHGFGGIGKTELAKKYVQRYKDQYDVTVFDKFNEKKGIEQFVQNISIKSNKSVYDNNNVEDKDDKWKEVEKLCTEKTLFVIDNFDVDDDENLEKLLSWKAKFIFTSRNDHSDICSEDIYQIELNAMNTDELITLFVHEFGRDLSEEEDSYVRKIFREFDNYTMMVPLIAKQLRASDMSLAAFWDKIDSEGLSGFGDDTERVKHRKDGKLTQATLLGHMNHLFDLCGLDDKYKCVLANIKSLEGHYELTKSVYREYTQENNLTLLNNLIDCGWINKVYERDYDTDEDVLTLGLHPIVSQLIEETLNDEKYYSAVIKNTYEKLVELNANPDDNSLVDEIGNVLRVYCDADSYNSKANLIYEEMFKFISYKYKKGYLNVHKVFFNANRFVNSASSEYFYEKIKGYVLDNNVKKLIFPNEIESFQDLDRILILLTSYLYNYYFHTSSLNDQLFAILCVNIYLNKVKRIIDSRENAEEIGGELQLSGENVRIIEEFVANLLYYLALLKNDEKWLVSPRYSFDGQFDLVSNPLIAEMYLLVAGVSYSLYHFFDLLKEEKKASGYLSIYKRIISVLLYYQGEFVIPEMLSVKDPKNYYKEWEKMLANEESETEEEEILPEITFVNLLYCDDRASWRKKIGKSFGELIENERISKENYKIFLSFDFLNEQPAVIRKALKKYSIFDIVYFDDKLTDEEKKDLLYDFVSNEIIGAFSHTKTRKIIQKNSDILSIYQGCLEKFIDSAYAAAGTQLNNGRYDYYIAFSKTIICNKRKNTKLVDSIGREIVPDNREYVTELLELTKCVYNMGFHKIASSYYQKISVLWSERKWVREKSEGMWINYLLSIKIAAEKSKNRDIYDEVYEEINRIKLTEWISAIEDKEVYDLFKHNIIADCYWWIISEIGDILIQDGYEALTNSRKGARILSYGKKISDSLKKEMLPDRVKNTQIGKCFEALYRFVKGSGWYYTDKEDYDYFIRSYAKKDKFNSSGEFVLGKIVLLTLLMFGNENAKELLESLESKLTEKEKNLINDRLTSIPERTDFFDDSDDCVKDDMPF